ncbi:hypothetical protein EON63_09430 [archaeon]|nr:MAG: hypothetical protein EON63_09430 [archaeon]
MTSTFLGLAVSKGDVECDYGMLIYTQTNTTYPFPYSYTHIPIPHAHTHTYTYTSTIIHIHISVQYLCFPRYPSGQGATWVVGG